MEHFVTLFDRSFVPQGLTLLRSLSKHSVPFNLWILCLDQETYDFLCLLSLNNVNLINLKDVETDELKQIRPSRTSKEFAWTLTPFAPRFVFESNSNVQRVTYLDADLFFLKSPLILINELIESGKSVLITEHSFSPHLDDSERAGLYCVQFITFTRNEGEVVRKWWEEKCIDWCYARYEDGKFGDQKYLDLWPILFPNLVKVTSIKGAGLAPWNSTRFPYSESIFYHFHGLRVVNRNLIYTPYEKQPSIVFKEVYTRYLLEMNQTMLLVGDFNYSFENQYTKFENRLIKLVIKKLLISFQLHFLLNGRFMKIKSELGK